MLRVSCIRSHRSCIEIFTVLSKGSFACVVLVCLIWQVFNNTARYVDQVCTCCRLKHMYMNFFFSPLRLSVLMLVLLCCVVLVHAYH